MAKEMNANETDAIKTLGSDKIALLDRKGENTQVHQGDHCTWMRMRPRLGSRMIATGGCRKTMYTDACTWSESKRSGGW